jgi:hypothetical protein
MYFGTSSLYNSRDIWISNITSFGELAVNSIIWRYSCEFKSIGAASDITNLLLSIQHRAPIQIIVLICGRWSDPNGCISAWLPLVFAISSSCTLAPLPYIIADFLDQLHDII